ncbi:MAG TPA: class I SAM-dependent methyltransferase [Candidatus Paceibacterota bacterium]|nr:class I SAM-dependent methyltransferase [Candidatus Paceibacterota bacterium]
MNKKEQTIATYNATAGEMAKKFRGIGARVADIEKAFSFVGAEDPQVLEIGCGDGRDAQEILKRTKRYLGIDISSAMVSEAKRYAPEGRFEVADVESYEFPSGLDVIFSFASLLHSDKDAVRSVLARAHEALNDNGIFYISLKHDEYGEVTKTDEFGTRTYYMYSPELIEELAGDAYETAYKDEQELRGQRWFTIALRAKA